MYKRQGKRVLAVILTGMGSDGTAGVRALKEACQCYCITQSRETSVDVYKRQVETINKVIEETTQITNAIAAAVTEQSAITGEISTSILDAASEVNLISEEIQEVAEKSEGAAQNAGKASAGVQAVSYTHLCCRNDRWKPPVQRSPRWNNPGHPPG